MLEEHQITGAPAPYQDPAILRMTIHTITIIEAETRTEEMRQKRQEELEAAFFQKG